MNSFSKLKVVAVAATALGMASMSTASFAEDELVLCLGVAPIKRASPLAFFSLLRKPWASPSKKIPMAVFPMSN